MRFEIPICPACGEPACKVTETIPCTAGLTRNDDGSFRYAGESDLDWDNQKPVMDEHGQATLGCEEGHEWQSAMTGA